MAYSDVETLRNDPRAAAEGLQKATSLNPAHLAELCEVEKREAEEFNRRWREDSRSYWRLWNNEVDFPSKEDWQTQLWVPKVFTAVEQATALIQRSLIDTPESFGVEGIDDSDKELAAKYWKPLLKLFLDRGKFAYKFADAAKMGFITGLAGYLKFRPTSVAVPMVSGMQLDQMGRPVPSFTTTQRAFLAIDFVMPWNIRRDPDAKARENYSGTYLWHSEWKDRAMLRHMQQRGWNAEVIEELLATPANQDGYTDMQREEWEQRQAGKRHKFRRNYMLDEGWLDVLDENGDVIFPNALMVHSNKKILYGPVENPLWATDLNTGRRKWPFVATAPLVDPSKFVGRGIVEQQAPLAWLYSNVFMLWSDGLNWLVNPPTEVNQDVLVEYGDTSHYPGKLWVKRGDGQALTPAQMGQMKTDEIMGALEYIDRVGQNSNFVNDFVTGLPGTRSDITKGEVQIKTGQSLAIFEAMGKNLELMGKESVELTYDLLLQFFDDFTEPTVSRILGPQAAQYAMMLTVPQRVEMLQGNFDFKFTGVSQALMKADKLQKMLQFATLAASPYFAGRVPPDKMLKVLADLLDVSDRIDVFTDEQLMMMQAQRMMQLQSMGINPASVQQVNGQPSGTQQPPGQSTQHGPKESPQKPMIGTVNVTNGAVE